MVSSVAIVRKNCRRRRGSFDWFGTESSKHSLTDFPRQGSVSSDAVAGDERSAESETVARGEIIDTPSSAFWVVLLKPEDARTSRIMFCKPAEFAGPINLMPMSLRISPASSLISPAKRRHGSGLKLTAGNQTTKTRLVPLKNLVWIVYGFTFLPWKQ